MAHKVDSSGATAQNEFTNGGGAVARTRLEAKFCNMVQREVVAIPTARGLALSDTDDQQLLQCLIMHVADITGLRAMPVPTIPSTQSVGVFVRDAGTGLARFYAWASTSSAADNAGTVIRPSSNPATGRWLSISMMDAGTTSSVAWASVTGKPTTVSGYGISDMGSQSVNYANSAGAVPWSGVSSKPTTIAGYGITDHSWSNLTGKPSTVSGFGISDMGSQSVNYANSAGAVAWSGVTSRPTTISGYGITDHSWSNLTGKPSTVSGFGISDMSSQSVSYANSAGGVPWSGVSSKPSTVSGYGISDMGSQSVNYANIAGSAATASSAANATNSSQLGGVAAASYARKRTSVSNVSRPEFTNYTNSGPTDMTIIATVSFYGGGTCNVYINGVFVCGLSVGGGFTGPMTFDIPDGSYWQIQYSGSVGSITYTEIT